MNIPPPVDRFRDNTITLAHYCKNIIINAYNQQLTSIQPIYVQIGLHVLENGYTGEELINNFIKFSYLSWDKIKVKDEDFFDQNKTELFNAWPTEVIQMFHSLFFTNKPDGTPLISAKQKEYIWNAVQSFVKISIQHIYESRQPYRTQDGSIEFRFNNQYDYITDDLFNLARKWEIYEKLKYV